MDIVQFGEITKWDGHGKDYGVIWEDPREIHRVVVTFAGEPPPAESLALEYWQSSWPEHEIPRDEPSGSGQSGWFNVGDWFQGKWQVADSRILAAGNGGVTFLFKPLNEKEFPELDKPVTYRTTFKLRIVSTEPLPEIRSFEAFTDSQWNPLDIELEWGANAADPETWDRRLEVFNGAVERLAPLRSDSAVSIAADNSWISRVLGRTDGIRARILCATPGHYGSFDETVITVRTSRETFSFSASDLLRWGHVIIPDFGVMARLAGKNVSYVTALHAIQDAAPGVYSRVAGLPEQSFPGAWNDVPEKAHQYIPIGFEGGRQHFGLDGQCNVFCNTCWLRALPGKDTDRCGWDSDQITYRFGLPPEVLKHRTLIDGCLPITVSTWESKDVRYTQTAFVTPLHGLPPAGERIKADDTLVLMMRFEMTLLAGLRKEARLEISVLDGDKFERLGVNRDRIIVAERKPRPLRMLVSDQKSLSESNVGVLYRVDLTTESRARSVVVVIPYITLCDPEDSGGAPGDEWRCLRALEFKTQFDLICEYWRKRLAEGARITTPEPMINDFYKAHVSHLLLNTERDVALVESDRERYMAKVGTFYYGVFANEACMMVSDLDRRGYHKRAEEAIETWLHYQGSRALPGDFSSCEGELYGAGGYEDQCGYNQHHGWVLWCIAEHYRYTRDNDWLAHAAPYVVKACDWIANERRRTTDNAARSPIRAIEKGLLPQGSLEDIADWRGWLSTNVYTWWGLDSAASVLLAANHPDGKRFADEATAYKRDLIAAFTEAMRRSPVVRLRDGSWVPHIPSDVHRRGRSFGWITETLEGAIHLVRCGALDPWDPISTWIIKDYEDNLYLSKQFGYDLTGAEFDRYWFSRGGISQQANLLCNPIAYLLRDEPKHFLRAYFNAFAVSYFPDTRMMTEHALPNIGDWRGDHYKSSDEANSTYWLRLMFIDERGDDLWLGAAIPRNWLDDGQDIGIENAATYFGNMSIRYRSNVATGKITATIDPPRRNAPRGILVRFRHPRGARIARCEVNGLMYAEFDPEKEWVILENCVERTEISTFYE